MATTQYGGGISIDTLENMRRSGKTDDEIADFMSSYSPTFQGQVSKIRKKYGSDPSATTAFLNTRFYGTVDHTPDKPKGFIGRSLDRITENFKKDWMDIGEAMESRQSGQQGLVDTGIQTFGNVASIIASPVSQPIQEGVASVGRAAFENIPGVKPAVQAVGRAIAPVARPVVSFLSEESARNPALRSLAAVGEGAADLADFAGGAALAKQGTRAGIAGARMLPQVPALAGRAAGATVRGATYPIRAGLKGFVQGVKGKTAQAAGQAVKQIDDTTEELLGVAQEAVKAGMDEKVVRFAVQQNAETRKAMAAMTEAANKGAAKLGGDTAHKEILGQYVLNNMEHVLNEKQIVGKALGAMKKGMADEVVDLTDDYNDFMSLLREAGATFDDKGRIVRLAAEADDNIPLLQQAFDFFQPDEAGRVVKYFKDIDNWRSKLFKEMNSAKAKLQPSSAGQSALGYAERVINGLRRSSINKASASNPRLIAYNDAFEELSTQASKFLKSIGYKGKLSIDDITAKDLRTGEVALRTLGNASADIRDNFTNLIDTARKYGYESNVDEMGLIRWADALEDVFPITPSRSLQGGVSRGTKDALGQFTEDVVHGGVRRGITGAVDVKLMETIDKMRGITPENRYRLLMDILNAPPDAPLSKVIRKALPEDTLTKSQVSQLVDQLSPSQPQQGISPQSGLPSGSPVIEEVKALQETLPQASNPVNMVDDVLPKAPPPSAVGAAGAQKTGIVPDELRPDLDEIVRRMKVSHGDAWQEAQKLAGDGMVTKQNLYEATTNIEKAAKKAVTNVDTVKPLNKSEISKSPLVPSAKEVRTPSVKQIYGDRLHKGTYKGKPVSSDAYMLEFDDIPTEGLGKVKSDVTPDDQWARLLDPHTDAIPSQRIGYVMKKDLPQIATDAVVIQDGNGVGLIAAHYDAYFRKKYGDISFKRIGENTAVYVEKNGELKGLIMPLRTGDTVGAATPKDILGALRGKADLNSTPLSGTMGDMTKTKSAAQAKAQGMSFDEWVKGQGETVYHGSDKTITKFSNKKGAQGVIWFTDNPKPIKAGESGATSTKVLNERVLTGKNFAGWDEYEKLGLQQIEDMGYDGIKLPTKMADGTQYNDYVLFDDKNLKTTSQLRKEWEAAGKSPLLQGKTVDENIAYLNKIENESKDLSNVIKILNKKIIKSNDGYMVKTQVNINGGGIGERYKIFNTEESAKQFVETFEKATSPQWLKDIKNNVKNLDKDGAPLLQEAKKYKSAEEFVKAQGTPVYRGQQIKYGGNLKDNAFFSANKDEVVNTYGARGGTSEVIEAYPKLKNPKYLDLNFDPSEMKNWDSAIATAKRQGHDGLIYREGTPNAQFVVFNKENIQTKSQLTDIWKQANQ